MCLAHVVIAAVPVASRELWGVPLVAPLPPGDLTDDRTEHRAALDAGQGQHVAQVVVVSDKGGILARRVRQPRLLDAGSVVPAAQEGKVE